MNTTQCEYPKRQHTMTRFQAPTADLCELPPDLTPIATTKRGITPETYALYGVLQDEHGNHVYPYRTNGHLVGYKVRHTNPKDFTHHWADTRATTVWTPLTQMSGNRYLVICEGEVDAMTVHQLTGYTTWSIPLGAPSADQYLARAGNIIDGYENVYLLFDNDQPGREGVERVTSMFPQMQVVTLPPQHKDPNAALKELGPEAATETIKRAIWGAQRPNKGYTLTTQQLVTSAIDHLYDKDKRKGISTGFHQLDALIGGHRGGEVNILVGGTGVGKSYLLRQLALNAANAMPEGNHVLYYSLEDPTWLAVTRYCELTTGKELLRSEDMTVSPEELTAHIEGLQNIEFACPDTSDLVKAVQYQARLGCKLVVLDHLTVLSERRELSAFTAWFYEFAQVLVDNGVSLLSAVHMSRDTKDKQDNMPSISRVKNSSAISQVAWSLIGVTRDRSTSRTKLEMLKNSRTWGTPGEAHLMLNPRTRRLEECDPPEQDHTPDSLPYAGGAEPHNDEDW